MVVLTVKEWCAQQKMTQFYPKVRVNTNKYPYVTFFNEGNIAENIYFSKNAASVYPEGAEITLDMLKQLQIGVVTNENGEQRTKLISNSERVELVW